MALRRHRFPALLLAAAIAAFGFVAAPPAQAAALGDSTLSGSTLTPSSFPDAQIGDTFNVLGTSYPQQLVNGTGTASYGGSNCVPGACNLPAGLGFTVTSLGTVTIQSGGAVVATLTLGPEAPAPDPGSGSTRVWNAPLQVASQPPTVVTTAGDRAVQLTITPGTGGTGAAMKYGIEVSTSGCTTTRSLSPRPIAIESATCIPCPRVSMSPLNTEPLCNDTKSILVNATSPTAPTITTVTGLTNGRSYTFSVKEMTDEEQWSGATAVQDTPSSSATCTSLSVDVAQPTGADASRVTSPVSTTSPARYPFIAPPYGGTVRASAIGVWNDTAKTGSAGGEYATFTPTTDLPCPITVTAPEGAKVSTSTGVAWNAGSQSTTVFSGTPVHVFGTTTGTYDMKFTAGSSLSVTPKVKIGTVPEAAYTLGLTPASQSLPPATRGTITASVTDAFGNAVPGVKVDLRTSAPYAFLMTGDWPDRQLTVVTGQNGSVSQAILTHNTLIDDTFTAAAPAGTSAWAWKPGYVTPAGFASPVSSATATTIAKSIAITDSGRATVSGKPGVYANGKATGFTAGDTLKVFVRFPPGQTEYEELARPVIGTDGTFEWSRKTVKKVYVYFVSDDGKLKSNSVIIPAA